jgi:TPR repeat protein
MDVSMSSCEQWPVIIRTAVLVLLLGGTGPVCGGWDEALAAERSGDYAKAFAEYRKLADAGDIEALHNLGVMYYNGYGVYLDYGKALQCFLEAAEHGVAGSQNNLGYMYARGNGVPQDFIRAHMWFDIAAANGDSTASDNRAIVASRMKPSEIAEAERLAREWLKEHPPVDRPVPPPARKPGHSPAYTLSFSLHPGPRRSLRTT